MAGLIEKAAALLRENPPKPAPPFALKATVYRDVYGIPHIFADSEETAAYAIAQAQCEDMGMQVFDNLRCGVGRTGRAIRRRRRWNPTGSCTCGACRRPPSGCGRPARRGRSGSCRRSATA